MLSKANIFLFSNKLFPYFHKKFMSHRRVVIFLPQKPKILSFYLICEFSVITQLNERNDTLTAELSDVKV